MSDLAEFLRARLDEDERATRQIGPESWHAHYGDSASYDHPDPAFVQTDGGEDVAVMERYSIHDATHIARHDPARVLREVGAKRQIVKLHGPVILRGGAGAKYFDTITVCTSCEPSHQFPESAFPCATLRLLALPYTDHPDYRPEWSPDV